MSTDVGQLLARQDYPAVIDTVASMVRDDPVAAFSDPIVQEWLGQRYRNLFLTECEGDPRALRSARVSSPLRLIDGRSRRAQLAKKFFRRLPPEEVDVEMPTAREVHNPDVSLVFAPDLMTGLLPVLAFQSVWPQIEARFGIDIIAADSHPVRSCAGNVADLAAAIETGQGFGPGSRKRTGPPPGDVVLIGYSKGAPDILQLLVERPDLAERIRAVVGWGGVFGGSYIADDIAEGLAQEGVDEQMPLSREVGRRLRRMVPVVQVDRVGRRIDEYDIAGAIDDETTAVRRRFWEEHLDDIAELGIPFLTVSGATTVTDVPYFQALGYVRLNAYDTDNDMQITQAQARPPLRASAHLAMFRAHHWDLAYDPFPWWQTLGSLNVDHKFARLPAMAALVLLLAEVGLLS